jgi:hypothetical protein
MNLANVAIRTKRYIVKETNKCRDPMAAPASTIDFAKRKPLA